MFRKTWPPPLRSAQLVSEMAGVMGVIGSSPSPVPGVSQISLDTQTCSSSPGYLFHANRPRLKQGERAAATERGKGLHGLMNL